MTTGNAFFSQGSSPNGRRCFFLCEGARKDLQLVALVKPSEGPQERTPFNDQSVKAFSLRATGPGHF